MRAASRVLIGVLVGVGLVGPLAAIPPAAAQPGRATGGPACPAVVADQPLSVTTPFSGTLRPRAGDDGRIQSASLLCAYGEGVAPAAEVTVTWDAGPEPCAATDVAVASGLEAAPFEQLATALAESAGRACAASSGSGWPVGAVAGGLVVGVAAGVALLRRRRARRATAGEAAGPPSSLPTPPTPPTPQPSSGPPGPVVPDPRPVLAVLAGPGGRDFSRTGAGQLAVLAALAYGTGDSVTGDLARAGSLAALPVGLPPRAEVAALAIARAHHHLAIDR